MADIIKNTLLGLGIYAIFVLVYTLVSAYQNINIWSMKWDWKKFLNGLAKWLLLGVAVLATASGSFMLLNLAKENGIAIANADAIAPQVIVGVVILASAGILVKIIAKLSTTIGLTEEQLKTLQQLYIEKAETEGQENIVVELEDLPQPSQEYVEALKTFEKKVEEKGLETVLTGVGYSYSVPINTYSEFRNAVMGKGYDIDGAYSYQCWDGSCLLWTQIGRYLYTGDGTARGCWTLKRNENAGNDFDLITDKTKIKRGDVLFFDGGQYGHTGYADEDYNGTNAIKLLGQNQSADMKFCVINMSLATFLGAMRFKKWKTVDPPKPTPAPAPTPAPSDDGTVSYTYKKGDTFGQVILDLGLGTSHGLWGADGDVAYYTEQLHQQGIYGNIPIGTTIKLKPRS